MPHSTVPPVGNAIRGMRTGDAPGLRVHPKILPDALTDTFFAIARIKNVTWKIVIQATDRRAAMVDLRKCRSRHNRAKITRR